ncbi:MAG: hypothetical protein RLZZ416_214 [Candidatus Parcubacteria bacterium]|jgi:peptide/nickel transport system substrate-binding protein
MAFDSFSYTTPEKLSVKLTRRRAVPSLAALERLLRAFSPGERLALYLVSAVLGLSTFALLAGLNAAISTNVPARGGSLTEGEVGSVRFINPVLALSQADTDLASLVYSGLMRAMPDGSIAPDLAESYEISQDGTVYTFHLRPDATFHDGSRVTSADVIYTVQATQNIEIKSPRRADWDGVAAAAPDERTVVFTLPHPYAPFLENTTLGILPKSIWQSVQPEEFPFSPANTRPIGSGPFKVGNITTDSTGSITRYELTPFNHFTLGAPHLFHLYFLYYPNEDAMIAAWKSGAIDSMAGISPSNLSALARTDEQIVRATLPRVFGVFFNQSHAPVLADASVREALDAATDREVIVDSILGGYGSALSGPIPSGVTGFIAPARAQPFLAAASSTMRIKPDEKAIAAARAILERGGWEFSEASSTKGSTGLWQKKQGKGKGAQTLSFTLSTADELELVATANALAESWRALGVDVDVRIYPISELNSSVIRPRAYDAILFGEVVGRTLDLFAFWHSSQRNDPGLNLAMYANSKADSLLIQARATKNRAEREKLYERFSEMVKSDTPAIFLYAPDFVYLVPDSLHGVSLGALTTPAERFLNAYQWYIYTERVWSVFAR